MIEKKHYWILSRGEQKPDGIPNLGTAYRLLVKMDEEHDVDDESELIAEIVADYIEMLGPYVHVLGTATIEDLEEYPCDAKYLADQSLPKGEKSGDLVVYNTIAD